METPTARRPPLGSGYESPCEASQPSYFTPPLASEAAIQTHAATQALGTPAPVLVQRPTCVSQPSFTAARPLNGQITPAAAAATSGGPNHASLNSMLSKVELERQISNGKVSLKGRIACYQWTYFTMTMATGGVANVLHSLNYDANWLRGIGIFFFLLNIVLFITNCVLITLRFHWQPGSFMRSFTDQLESLFIPAFFVSIAIIMINICEYGIPHAGRWLLHTMQILFWFYIGLSMAASAGMYLILWSTLIFPVHMMTPTWVFPAYPLLLTAPLAANLLAAAEATGRSDTLNTTAVAFCAATIQGTGCLIAFMISAAFIYRLMTQKLPRDMQRPGVFISIGPFGFTAAGIAQLGSQASIYIPSRLLDIDTGHTVDIIRVISLLVGLWLWGLSLWFFLVSVGSLWKYCRSGHSMPFQMTWWSFVFPNTALVTATEVMAQIFDSRGLHIFAAFMTACLIIVWVGVFLTMLQCLRAKKLLYPKMATAAAQK